MMNKLFHFLKFQELINQLGKYVFHWGKWNLEPMGNFAYNTEFLILGKALLILLPFYIILSLICNRVQKYFLQLEHHISLSYQRQLYLQMPLWIPGIYLKL